MIRKIYHLISWEYEGYWYHWKHYVFSGVFLVQVYTTSSKYGIKIQTHRSWDDVTFCIFLVVNLFV